MKRNGIVREQQGVTKITIFFLLCVLVFGQKYNHLFNWNKIVHASKVVGINSYVLFSLSYKFEMIDRNQPFYIHELCFSSEQIIFVGHISIEFNESILITRTRFHSYHFV